MSCGLPGMTPCIGRQLGPGRPQIETSCNLRENDCVVLTHDLDFGDILAATGGAKPSVVQIRASGVGVDRIGGQVIGGLALCADELLAGALVTIDATRTRVRLLPLPFRQEI